MWKVSVLVLVLAGVGLVSGACSELEYATMQASFSNCSSEFTQNTEDICQLLASVVEECSKLWLTCHDRREVGKMRDLHINHLIKSYQQDDNLEDCLVVKEYRMSGRTEGEVEEDILCDDATTTAVLKKLGNCSHEISTQVYTDIQELTSVSTISSKLCTALSAIGTKCVKDLNQCFATGDLLQMRKSHLEEMKSFLLRISKDKAPKDTLDNCKILDYTDDEDQLSKVTENQSDKEATTIVTSRAKTTTATTATAITSEGSVQVKGSRSAEFEPESEESEDEEVDGEVGEVGDTSTEAAERLHSRHSSSSSSPVIHPVIILFLSVLSYLTLL